jgi:hypothetical protein
MACHTGEELCAMRRFRGEQQSSTELAKRGQSSASTLPGFGRQFLGVPVQFG